MGLFPYLEGTSHSALSADFLSIPGWNATWPPRFATAELTRLQSEVTPVFLCPSDGERPGATQFRANLGISIHVLPPSVTVEHTSQMGAFVNGGALSPGDFADGLSNTVMFSERVLGDFQTGSYHPFRDFFADGTIHTSTADFVRHCRNDATLNPPEQYSYAGGSWLLGGFLNTWYTHVLTPNSRIPDCSIGPVAVDGGPGIVSARSLHRECVHAAMSDGSVRVISNTIAATIWSELGTRNGME